MTNNYNQGYDPSQSYGSAFGDGGNGQEVPGYSAAQHTQSYDGAQGYGQPQYGQPYQGQGMPAYNAPAYGAPVYGTPGYPVYTTNVSDKSRLVALLLCFFVGALGVHRFYVGKVGTGFLWLFTLGFLGIGCLVDFIMIALGSFTDSQGALVKKWES